MPEGALNEGCLEGDRDRESSDWSWASLEEGKTETREEKWWLTSVEDDIESRTRNLNFVGGKERDCRGPTGGVWSWVQGVGDDRRIVDFSLEEGGVDFPTLSYLGSPKLLIMFDIFRLSRIFEKVDKSCAESPALPSCRSDLSLPFFSQTF